MSNDQEGSTPSQYDVVDYEGISSALDLESLDADALFEALTAVEKAIPFLLLSVKSILVNLASSPIASSSTSTADEGSEVKEAIERYMTLLDKIQFVLRQTVYYIRETRISPSTLRPPPANAIPTPFASTLPISSNSKSKQSGNPADNEEEVQLGLYGTRVEAATLKEMVRVLKRLKQDDMSSDGSSRTADGVGDDLMSVDGEASPG